MWNVRMDFETLTVKLVSSIYQSEPIPWYTKMDSILYTNMSMPKMFC